MSHYDSFPPRKNVTWVSDKIYHFMTLPTFGTYFGTKKKKEASEKPMSK